METLVICVTGVAGGLAAHRFMKHRYYSRLDDVIWGVLGALLGQSLVLMGEVTGLGAQLLAAVASATFFLVITGMVRDEDRLPVSGSRNKKTITLDLKPSPQNSVPVIRARVQTTGRLDDGVRTQSIAGENARIHARHHQLDLTQELV